MAVNTDWVSDNSNKTAVQLAQATLNKVKKARYGNGKVYERIKISDHPLTYKEVLVMGKKEILAINHDVVVNEDDEVLEEVNFEELVVKEENTEDD
jgi:hypothetical protein